MSTIPHQANNSINSCSPHQYGYAPSLEAVLKSNPVFAQCYKDLHQRLKSLSFKAGHFILASGKSSPYYLDCRLTALDGKGSYLIGKLLNQLIEPLHVDAIGGMALGAAPLVTAVTVQSAASGKPLLGFLVRKEAKTHGRGKQIEGHLHPWMRIVLLEDVVTTGGSTAKAIRLIRKEHPSIQIAGVFAVVDRQAGGQETFKELGVPYHWLYSFQSFVKANASANHAPNSERNDAHPAHHYP